MNLLIQLERPINKKVMIEVSDECKISELKTLVLDRTGNKKYSRYPDFFDVMSGSRCLTGETSLKAYCLSSQSNIRIVKKSTHGIEDLSLDDCISTKGTEVSVIESEK